MGGHSLGTLSAAPRCTALASSAKGQTKDRKPSGQSPGPRYSRKTAHECKRRSGVQRELQGACAVRRRKRLAANHSGADVQVWKLCRGRVNTLSSHRDVDLVHAEPSWEISTGSHHRVRRGVSKQAVRVTAPPGLV
jgi:hypothetical protein